MHKYFSQVCKNYGRIQSEVLIPRQTPLTHRDSFYSKASIFPPHPQAPQDEFPITPFEIQRRGLRPDGRSILLCDRRDQSRLGLPDFDCRNEAVAGHPPPRPCAPGLGKADAPTERLRMVQSRQEDVWLRGLGKVGENPLRNLATHPHASPAPTRR